jgi:hypothetical protein
MPELEIGHMRSANPERTLPHSWLDWILGLFGFSR